MSRPKGDGFIITQQQMSLDIIDRGLASVGYPGVCRQRGYCFADMFANGGNTQTADIVAFGGRPFSYDTACIAAACSNGLAGASLATTLRALGAPMVLEVMPSGDMIRWKIVGQGEPDQLETVLQKEIPAAFERRKQEWSPASVMRGKAAHRSGKPVQLDFIDAGLLPAIGEVVNSKLHELLEKVVASAKVTYAKTHHGREPSYAALFRLVFRLLSAKVLGDKQRQEAWLNADAERVVTKVEQFYFQAQPTPKALRHHATRDVAWEGIRGAFDFGNISVDALAYVYENTLVTKATRQALGTHSTPVEIASYLVDHLPFEDVPEADRYVLEPCCGHAVFLVAAMRRMRDLLPLDMSPGSRHAYFVKRLAGIESDPFACEVALLSLMLADYPNPNGWRTHGEDVFTGPALDNELKKAAIVLCNPPFEDFTGQERRRYGTGIEHVQKPAEMLRRVLAPSPPQMLGFVLPAIFLTGRGYRDLRAQIGHTYSEANLVKLPDDVFSHSEAESALLLAHGRKTSASKGGCAVGCAVVSKPEWSRFCTSGRTSRSWEAICTKDTGSLWTSPLQDFWEELRSHSVLGEVAEIHRGIEWTLSLKEHGSELVSEREQRGFVRGLDTVRDRLREPFVPTGHVWLNKSRGTRTNAYRYPWDGPKVILNRARASRGAWRLIAVPDDTGLLCTERFFGIWPNGNWDPGCVAAVLNGPVANGFMWDREGQRTMNKAVLRLVPVPELGEMEMGVLGGLVRRYVDLRVHSREPLGPAAGPELRACLQQIDALVLKGYDLPPRLERELLDLFRGHRRPVPFRFDSFYPDDFRPSIPYHEYVSPAFQEAGARDTLKRLPAVDDEAIHEALVALIADDTKSVGG